MKTHTETVKEFISLVQQFKFVEAVDKFYAQDIIATDNDNKPRKGFDKFRKGVEIFVEDTELEKLELLSTIVEQDLSVVHWHYIFTNKTFGRLDYKQISVQRWKSGKIIQENHFYNL